MAIEVKCEFCGEKFRLRDEDGGRVFKCKNCGTMVRAPIPESHAGAFGGDEGAFYGSEIDERYQRSRSEDAARRTLGPAIGLYVTGAIWLIYLIFSAFIQGLNPSLRRPPGATEAYMQGQLIGYFAALALLPTITIVMLVGAFFLQTRRAYPLAMAACVIASIPCCSPCFILGIPFGVWGIVVLLNEDVKREFR